MKKKWTEQENELLTVKYNGKNVSEIALLLDRSVTSVKGHIAQLHLAKNSRAMKKWTSAEDEYLKSRYNGSNSKELADKLGRTLQSIRKRIKTVGLSMPRQKYTCNCDYFEDIDSPDKAYWLGFLSADGCVVDNGGSMKLKLTLKAEDHSHLEKLAKDLNSNAPIRDIEQAYKYQGIKRKRESSELIIHSTKLCKDLASHGVTSNKTYVLQPPSISNEYIWDYLRGFHDGDGSFSMRLRPGRTKPSVESSVVGASERFLNWYSKILNANGVNAHVYVKRAGNWRVVVSSVDGVDALINHFYNNSNTYLDRKYKIAMNIHDKIAV